MSDKTAIDWNRWSGPAQRHSLHALIQHATMLSAPLRGPHSNMRLPP